MRKLLTVLSIFFLWSCNNNGSSGSPAGDSAKPAPVASGAAIAATHIDVQLTGGSNAGTYSASSAEPTCSMGLTGPGSFGNQYSVSGKNANEFSSLQLIVDDYNAAKSGTDKFYIKVAFGKVLQGNKYEINGSDNSIAGKKQGSGKLTILESGNQKIATVKGTTADGVTINATITCSSIVTAQGAQ